MIQFTQQQFFSFSDFLTALSLVVLAWGTTDPRYQFRTKIIPSLFSCMPSFSFRKLTFYVIAFVGFCILSLEMDQAVLGNSRLINHYAGEIIRGVLACTLLAFFIRWIYCSFIRPAVFSEKNSFNFLEAIKVAISRSSDSELMAAAEETEKSISQIIAYASSATDKLKNNQSPLNVELHAQKILVAITDKRFCEKIVESAPEFLVSIFTNIKNQTCARAFLPFAHNILIAAIGNPYSFLFRETELDDAGWINPVTPVCSAMFANYSVVEITENLIITDNSYLQFNPKQWQAYCRIVTKGPCKATFQQFFWMNHMF